MQQCTSLGRALSTPCPRSIYCSVCQRSFDIHGWVVGRGIDFASLVLASPVPMFAVAAACRAVTQSSITVANEGMRDHRLRHTAARRAARVARGRAAVEYRGLRTTKILVVRLSLAGRGKASRLLYAKRLPGTPLPSAMRLSSPKATAAFVLLGHLVHRP